VYFFVTAQCVRSSNALDMLSLYSVFAPAMPLTCCHCTLCSLQQCPWRAVTVHCVRSSNALDMLSLYSVFAPAMPLTCCHCTVCSLQQCPWRAVTVQCVLSSSALDILSLWVGNPKHIITTSDICLRANSDTDMYGHVYESWRLLNTLRRF